MAAAAEAGAGPGAHHSGWRRATAQTLEWAGAGLLRALEAEAVEAEAVEAEAVEAEAGSSSRARSSHRSLSDTTRPSVPAR